MGGSRTDPRQDTLAAAFAARERAHGSVTSRAGDRARQRLFPGPFGRYRVVREVGAGGFGVVYAGHDPDLDRRVAIKVLRPAGAVPSELERRAMIGEAQAIARVVHPNVVEIFDLGWEGESFYVVMELLEGPNLSAWSIRTHAPREILAAFIAAGRGLAAVHASGLVHRDFKPSNVLTGPDGVVKVTDFGLARVLDRMAGCTSPDTDPTGIDSPQIQSVTVGSVVGTVPFMSPEQQQGHDVDARTDIYAFAAALTTALLGRHPFPGETREAVLLAKLANRIDLPREIDGVGRGVAAVLRRALRADPDQRFADMTEVLDALRPPRRRWLVAVAVPIAAVGVLMASLPAAPTRCDEGRATARQQWDAQRAGVVHREHDEESDARSRARAALVDRIDDYVERWTVADAEVCGDPPVDPARIACLQDELVRLDRLVELARPDPALTLVGVSDLPDPSRCRDRPPPSVRRAPHADALLADLEVADFTSARASAIDPTLDELDRTLAVDDADARAKLGYWRGLLAHVHRDRAGARTAWLAAYDLARVAENVALADRIALGLASHYAHADDRREAERWLGEADAIAGGQRSPVAEGRRLAAQFRIDVHWGGIDTALATGNRALRGWEAIGLAETRQYLVLLRTVLDLERIHGRGGATLLPRLRDLVAQTDRLLGAASVEASDARRVLAGQLFSMGQSDEGFAVLDEAASILGALPGTEYELALVLFEIGRGSSARECDLARGIAAYDRALALLAGREGPIDQAFGLLERAELELLGGEVGGAGDVVERAAVIMSEAAAPEHVGHAGVAHARARVSAAEQHWDDAARSAEQAAEGYAAAGKTDWVLAHAWALTALAAAHVGRYDDAERAVEAAARSAADRPDVVLMIEEARARLFLATSRPHLALEAVERGLERLPIPEYPLATTRVESTLRELQTEARRRIALQK